MNAPESPKGAAVRSHAQGSGGGFLLGLTAYALWGVLPVYFKSLASISPIDIVAHRVLWSLPFLAILVSVTRGWGKLHAGATRPRLVSGVAALAGGAVLFFLAPRR